MKNKIYRLFIAFFAIGFMTSCNEELGTVPGNDSNPVATIYQYTPSTPYNSDNDIFIRVAANNKTVEAYYMVEKTADITMSEKDYMDYVVANGIKLTDISGESTANITLTGLYGPYTITIVAVGNNGTKTSAKTTFTGLEWTDMATGTYYFEVNANTQKIFGESAPTVLQMCTSNDKLYRFKDLFGAGYSMKFNLLDLTDKDEDGDEYTFFRIPVGSTPFTYGTYGLVSYRDVGYWQGNDSFITSGGYESGIYEDYSCFICIQYFVSAGSIGYGYDYFIPN